MSGFNNNNEDSSIFYKQSTRINHCSISSKTSDRSQEFLEINIEPKAVLKIITAIVFCLIIVGSLGQIYSYVLGEGSQGKIVTLFNLDAEASVPTIYASFTLLLCSVLLAIIAKSKHHQGNYYRRHWTFLSIIFLYLAVDEGAKIHEISIDITRKLLNTSGFFHYAWVIPAIFLFSIFSLIYFKFVLSLPSDIKFLFVLAALIFVGGALGIEMIGGQFVTLQGKNAFYATIVTIEETLEMAGIAIFIYGLLEYIRQYVKPVKFSLENSKK